LSGHGRVSGNDDRPGWQLGPQLYPLPLRNVLDQVEHTLHESPNIDGPGLRFQACDLLLYGRETSVVACLGQLAGQLALPPRQKHAGNRLLPTLQVAMRLATRDAQLVRGLDHSHALDVPKQHRVIEARLGISERDPRARIERLYGGYQHAAQTLPGAFARPTLKPSELTCQRMPLEVGEVIEVLESLPHLLLQVPHMSLLLTKVLSRGHSRSAPV
jgi:hypothetical protein